MKGKATSGRGTSGGVRALAGVLLFLWLGTFALAALPQLHRLLHEDADQVTHHCLIAQIRQQALLAGFSQPPLPAPPAQVSARVLAGRPEFLATFDCRLAPSRAPPSALLTPVIAG